MKSKSLNVGVLVLVLTAGASFAQTDLDTYIEERRAAGMTEMAEISLKTASSILSGASVFTVQKTEGESYGRSYMSALCFSSGDDSMESKTLRAELTEKKDREFQRLRKLADLDESGFVSTTEGSRVRELVEFGLQFEQMEPEDKLNTETIAAAYGHTTDWVMTTLTDYRRLAIAFNTDEGTKLPAVEIAQE